MFAKSSSSFDISFNDSSEPSRKIEASYADWEILFSDWLYMYSNGVARTLKKLRTSKEDYWTKQ